MVEHRIQFAFKGKRKHIEKANMKDITYPNQHNDIEIPHDHVNVPDTVKIPFDLDIESTDKARSVVNNAGRALVKKRFSCLVQLTTPIFMTRTRTFI